VFVSPSDGVIITNLITETGIDKDVVIVYTAAYCVNSCLYKDEMMVTEDWFQKPNWS
jgi:hypothetical protein